MSVISLGKLRLSILQEVGERPLIVTESNIGGERKDV